LPQQLATGPRWNPCPPPLLGPCGVAVLWCREYPAYAAQGGRPQDKANFVLLLQVRAPPSVAAVAFVSSVSVRRADLLFNV
jgi:hypothetical protein